MLCHRRNYYHGDKITINLLKDQILLGIKLFKLFNFYKRKLKVKVLIVWLFLISTIR